MRKIHLVLLAMLILVFAVSCGDSSDSGNTPVDPSTDITLDVDNLSGSDLSISGSQKIVIENLDEGEFVAFVPVSSQKSVEGMSTKAGESTPVLKTELGTFIPMRDKNGKVEFYGKDLGVDSSSKASFRPIKLTSGTASIDLNANPAPVPTYKEGDKSEYYEVFAEYDLTNDIEITDPKKVVLVGSGSGGTGHYVYCSGDFGILDTSYWEKRSTSSVMDLSGIDKLYLYLGFKLEAINGHTISEYKADYGPKKRMISQEISAVTPFTLEIDETLDQKTEKKKALSIVHPSTGTEDSEYCLKIVSKREIAADMLNEVIGIANGAFPLYVESGKLRGSIVPYFFDGTATTYVYLGKIDKEFYFPFDTNQSDASITLIDMPEGHNSKIHTFEESDIPTTKESGMVISLDPMSYEGFRIKNLAQIDSERKLHVKFYTDAGCETPVNKEDEYAKMIGLFLNTSDAYGYGVDFLYAADELEFIRIQKGSAIRDGYFANTSGTPVWVKLWIE